MRNQYRSQILDSEPVYKVRHRHGVLFYTLIFFMIFALTNLNIAIFLTCGYALFNLVRGK